MQRALVIFLALIAPAISRAEPSLADRAASEAEALAKSGDFAGAAAKFRAAWQADKRRPELFCNIGISFYKAKDLVRAHLLLEQCLQQAALDDKIAGAVRGALRSVEDVLRTSGHAPVRIAVDPTATVIEVVEFAPDIVFVGPRVVWLPFGTYHLVARSEGHRDATTEVILRSAEPRTVELALQRRQAVAAPPPPTPVVATKSAKYQQRSLIAPISTTALTVLAAGVAAYAGFAGHSRASLAGSALDQATYDSDRQAVSQWNTTMVVAGSVCAVGAVASGYLWYRALRTEETRVALHASGEALGLAVTGQF